MTDCNELVEGIKRAALDAINATNPAGVVFGTVISVSPLSVSIDQKMTLTALMFALKFDNAAIEQVISIVTAVFVLIAYIVGEGVVDACNKDKED